jgi:hypothetical protein
VGAGASEQLEGVVRIGLYDADTTRFPNLALMKLAAFHKVRGDEAEWYTPERPYEWVYSSKVFTFTDEAQGLPGQTVRSGTGYGNPIDLPDEIEHLCPDYALYEIEHSLGFLTRGCPRACEWCFVPAKEGAIRAHADVEEFLRHPDVVLMDNNVLAHDHGIQQIEKLARLGVKVDFNQGLDARLIDDGIARRLSKLKWLHPVRLACDRADQITHVGRAVQLLRWHNTTPRRYFCYVLVKDVDDAVERIKFLKGLGVDPFAQPYLDKEGTLPTNEQRALARWVNHKAEFKSRTWEEYRCAHLS